MKIKNFSSEKGQTLVIVVIAFFAFVAVLALVLDGGNAYAAKRSAQNSADAGALAAAQYMCQHYTDGDVITETIATGQEYAGYNGADDFATVIPYYNDASVVVTATVTKNTFFAGLIGFDEVSPRAVAEAGCKNPGVGVLPVAWSCRAPVEGGLGTPGLACVEKVKPENVSPYDLDYTYIAMDSVKVSSSKKGGSCNPDALPGDPNYCYEQGDVECYVPAEPDCAYVDTGENKIDCDIDDDCIDELMTGGARAWLDLDGAPGGGASEVRDWIEHPEDLPEVTAHDWLPSAQGVDRSIFSSATTLVGKDVVLPVFNNLCKTGIPDIEFTLSADQIKSGYEPVDNCTYTQLDDLSIAGSNVNYHVFSFSAFHITCVQTGKNKNTHVFAQNGYEFNNSKEWCNGHYAAWQAGAIDDNDKTIEGYFTILNVGGFGGIGHWNNTGTFTVVLTR